MRPVAWGVGVVPQPRHAAIGVGRVGPRQTTRAKLAQMEDEYRDPHRTRYRACPICGSDRIGVLRDQDWSWRPDFKPPLSPVIRWMVCEPCAHEFAWGYHDKVGRQIVFASAQASQTAQGMTGTVAEEARLLWADVVDAVSRYRPEGHWLDIGAGSGMLLATAEEYGYTTAAIEARPLVAQALAALGIEVIGRDVSDLTRVRIEEESVDVVTMCDVLEHLPFPLSGLAFAAQVLRPEGILFLSCPNRASFAWKRLSEEGINPYYSEIEHYHNFSYSQIRTLLSNHGFEPLACSVSGRYRLCMDVVARRAVAPGDGVTREISEVTQPP
jgi:protein O-GlcNAc transferase